jgi:hypothetical protein
MAAPDCDMCAMQGFRACDRCGAPVMDGHRSPMGVEACFDCR